MLWLVLKSYEVIFKRFLVFSQSDGGGLWHLIIDKYYQGQMFYSQGSNCWMFRSNSGEFDELFSYFETYMIGWFA